jgi:hypothetical protein
MAAATVTDSSGGTTTTPAAPAPGASPIPLASGDYATAAATANAAYQSALSQINNQRQQALQSFGYSGTIDPTTGQLTNMQVDPHNPYGQYQQMLGQGAADQQAVQANSMARGLGSVSGARGGGLAAQDLSNAKLAFGGQSAALGENLMGTLGGLTSQQQDAQNTMNNALWQAELASAQNAIQGQSFDPANFSGVTDAPAKGGAVPAAKTYTTSADAGSVPKTTKVTPQQSTTAGKGVHYRQAKGGNTFHRAVRNRHTSGRGRRRR